jgi:hypothetical protein
MESGADIETIAERYHLAAERLSRSFNPGEGGRMQVQQLFLAATWYKAAANFVQGWHTLGTAIREAQEIGEAG